MFRHAIVRTPGKNFAEGLTTVNLGIPDFEKTLQQHQHYCEALEKCGVELVKLPDDLRYPDSTFVEDVAILLPEFAVLTNPGADSRKGEVDEIKPVISKYYQRVYTIKSPGTLDGGDICEAGSHLFIGISERTNEEGGRQLAEILAKAGYSSSFVEVRGVPDILHLKSGIAYLGDNNLVLIKAFSNLAQFKSYHIIRVEENENYAANCVQVNDFVLLPNRFPQIKQSLLELGYQVIPLDMSEYRKMDGGLSCLSLRF
ncbi:MAG: N(G),N(G)-dimethylarginine dimethylaminohydrolase [Planctomycetes bacterium]|nr:N(G),N(G)-dimethylarginine dimethylaminohydrolase [Planctomycetota bacterium]